MTLGPGARRLLAAAVLLGGVYLLAVIGVSLTSREDVLGVNQPKQFCGLYIDCHRHVALAGVEHRDTIAGLPARGTFHVVTLRFASNARRAVMHLGPLSAIVMDDTGRRYRRAAAAERALATDGAVTGLPDSALAPGGAFTTRIVFDLPPEAANARLLVQDSHPLSRLTELFLIGDEDSLLHARTTFALAPVAPDRHAR